MLHINRLLLDNEKYYLDKDNDEDTPTVGQEMLPKMIY